MITSNGNGSYGVEFQVNGEDDYVTVDSQLQSNGVYGLYYAKTGADSSIWVPLVEKAYAELTEQTSVFSTDNNANSYAGINGGWDNGLSALTGQTTDDYPTSSPGTLATALTAATANNEDVMIASYSASNGWVNDHMYSVTNFNSKTDMITVRNPWGTGAGGYEYMTMSLSDLPSQDLVLIANGKPAAA